MSIEPFIHCSDIKTTLGFYTGVLDFLIVRAPDPDPESFMSKYALLKREDCLIHLSAHSGDGVFGSVTYVRVDNVDSLYLQFIDNGLDTSLSGSKPALTMQPTTQSWGMKEFAVIDPDGNKLRFGQAL